MVSHPVLFDMEKKIESLKKNMLICLFPLAQSTLDSIFYFEISEVFLIVIRSKYVKNPFQNIF